MPEINGTCDAAALDPWPDTFGATGFMTSLDLRHTTFPAQILYDWHRKACSEMTSRFERRVAKIERMQRVEPEPPPDPRGFVLATLIGFHCCEAGMERLVVGFWAAHGINIEAKPTPDAVGAMQRLLDGVPERWRDADMAWWPTSASEMWAA